MENISGKISSNIKENISFFEETFSGCGDIVKKPFLINRENEGGKLYVIYVDGLTDNEMIERTILRPVLWEWRKASETDLWREVFYRQVETADISEETDMDNVMTSILKGDTAIFIDGYAKAMVVSSKNYPLRGIEESDKEKVTRGPKDSFNEGFRKSTALIRRRIRDPKLKVKQLKVGVRSRSDIALVYIDDLVDKEIVEEAEKRISKYDIAALIAIALPGLYIAITSFHQEMLPRELLMAIAGARSLVTFPIIIEVILMELEFELLREAGIRLPGTMGNTIGVVGGLIVGQARWMRG